MSPIPEGNDPSVRQNEIVAKLFETTSIPDHIEGFKVTDPEKLHEVWPEGSEKAKEVRLYLVSMHVVHKKLTGQVLQRFLYTKARKEQFKLLSPLNPGQEEDPKNARIQEYMTGRNLVAADYSSRLSPYLTSGILSGRMVCNEARKLKGGKLESGRDTGIGMWVQEVSPFVSNLYPNLFRS